VLGRDHKGIVERLSWKSIGLTVIAVLGFYFVVPDYLFSIRPQFVANVGSDVVSFIEGAILSAIVVISVLKLYSHKTPQRLKKIRKTDILGEYIIGTVRTVYPALFDEIRRNSERLDNFLENPDTYFVFPELDEIYNRGLEEFIKRHHHDLFLLIDSFQKKIRPKFKELNILVTKSMKKIFDIWEVYLRKSLPKEVVDTSGMIARDLIRTTNISTYVLPDLLNERDEKIRNKMEECFLDRTSHIYREKTKRPYVIRGQQTVMDYDEISQSLIEKAKPEVAKLIETYKELKEQNDKEVKAKLLPLLQKYISNPI